MDDDQHGQALHGPAGRDAAGHGQAGRDAARFDEAAPDQPHAHVGYVANKDELLKRLGRAEGQVRGIARMVENETYCIDILTQVSAATKALERVALSLLQDHLSHCVAEATAEGGEVAQAKLQEAGDAIARLVRS